MRYLPFLALGLLGCVPNPDVLVMKEDPAQAGQRDTDFFINGKLASKETSGVQDGHRTNVWRYYEKGVLVREDTDTNFDGSIDTIKHFDPKSGTVIKLVRDTNFDGSFDSVVEYDDKGVATPAPAPVNLPATSGPSGTLDSIRTPDEDYSAHAAQARKNDPIRQPARNTPSASVSDDEAAADAGQPAPVSGANRPASLKELMGNDAAVDTSALSGDDADASAPRSSAKAPAAAVEDTVDGTVIQRITPPSRLNTVTPATTGRGVVPDATFQHPSGSLDD